MSNIAAAPNRLLHRWGQNSVRFAKIFARIVHYSNRVNRGNRNGRLTEAELHACMTDWAREMLELVNVRVVDSPPPVDPVPSIYVGNHVSYLDIPLLMSLVPVLFVAKKQVARWPIIGEAAKSVGTLLVDRDSKDSRQTVTAGVPPIILERRQSVVLFPSGTTTMAEEKPWRWGPFRIAYDHGIPIRPFRIRYSPMRRAAYLKEDPFLTHLCALLGSDGLTATVEFADTFIVRESERDCAYWWNWSRAGL